MQVEICVASVLKCGALASQYRQIHTLQNIPLIQFTNLTLTLMLLSDQLAARRIATLMVIFVKRHASATRCRGKTKR